MVSIGVDIGTTTICACVLDTNTGEVLKTWTKKHGFIAAPSPKTKIQSVNEIESMISAILNEITTNYDDIACLGLTGQMHGILYLDSHGSPVSPLITWQDERGHEIVPGETVSYAQKLSQLTGYPCATGFGAVTHFYNVNNDLVPSDAVSFCTIHDYIMMKLGRLNKPVTHPSDAASIGLFDLTANKFDEKAIIAAGMDPSFFPAVSHNLSSETAYGFPAAVAIGDNQACFHGSVRDPQNSILVNVGTGSQISCWTKCFHSGSETIETRPYLKNDYILSGSSLCGGRAYALLESFFREFLSEAGYSADSLYDVMNRMAASYDTLSDPLIVETTFCGSRQNPDLRGSISNIGTDNFTPAHLTAGFLQGCVNELYAYFEQILPIIKRKPRYLVGSGNGLRRNPALQSMFSRTFQMELLIPAHLEEAAYGAALFAMICTMPDRDPQEIRNLIRYQD